MIRNNKNQNNKRKRHNESQSEDESVISYKRTRKSILSTSESEDQNSKKSGKNILDITWTTEPARLKLHHFSKRNSGIRVPISHSASILDYFQLFFSESFVEFIVKTTNDYEECINNNNAPSPSRGTSLDEMYRFLCIKMLMSRNKKLSHSEYWANDELLRSKIFGEIMSRDRFLHLLKILHFNTNDMQANVDRLYKIREICDMLRESFKNALYPFQDLCIDESLLLYKGRLSFKQYIPSKRNRFGIKSFVLCDKESGFVQDFIIYDGSLSNITNTDANLGKSGNIVVQLFKPYLEKGHTLFVDNWYTSPALFIFLHKNGTNACGTVKKRRKGMPRMDKKLKKGEASFWSSECLLAMKWHDKREVYMLSTFHTEEFVDTKIHYRTKEMIIKPKCVVDYNRSMGAVDKTDMIISTIHSQRKNLKWYKKYFFHLLDICIWNAYCLYKLKSGKYISMAKFHLELIRQILRRYHSSKATKDVNKSGHINITRLTARHFPSLYENNKTKRKSPLRKCVVCKKNDKTSQTRYQCKNCDVGLCVYPCFEKFHTEYYY